MFDPRQSKAKVIEGATVLYERYLDLTAENQRLRAELDPPICRLQFPDGTVPGNIREAAEGWKRWSDHYYLLTIPGI